MLPEYSMGRDHPDKFRIHVNEEKSLFADVSTNANTMPYTQLPNIYAFPKTEQLLPILRVAVTVYPNYTQMYF